MSLNSVKDGLSQSRKMVLMNLSTGQEQRLRHRKQNYGNIRGRRGRDKWREWHRHMCIVMYKIDS